MFVLFEIACRVAGWGSESSSRAPFAEFTEVRPLFRLSESDDRWHVADNRREFFAEESFPAAKQKNGFRIFVFGGSTVQGRPFSIPTSFGTFLQLGLQTADPATRWEVINCGGISYASYRLLPIMKECLAYEPDMYIVCTGHNEFLECITYNKVRQSAAFLKHSYSWLYQFNSFRLLAGAAQPQRQTVLPDTTLPIEVDAILDHQGGLEAYSRQNLNSGQIADAFENNLQKMVAMAESADVPLLFIRPPSNLRDCPPFKSQFSANTDTATQESIVESLRSINAQGSDEAARSVRRLEAVVAKDDRFALSWYQLGRALIRANRFEEAVTALIRARDEDVCPLRMTTDLEAALKRVAAETEIQLVDVHALLATESRNSIVGNATLVDHVHPSFQSNQKIAMALMHILSDRNILSLSAKDWKNAAVTQFSEHLQTLDDLYFLRGQRTLDTLAEWAQGRADGPPLKLHKGIRP